MVQFEKLDDEVIFELITQSKEEALDKLFKRYFFRLCNYVFPFVKNERIAEEIVSDVFIKLWIKRTDINIRSNVKSYLFRSAKNATLNYLAAQKNKLPESIELVEDQLLVADSWADSNLRFQELEREINDLMHQLPSQQKEIVRLNKLEGFTPKEIASLLDISTKTVYNNLYEAVKFLLEKYNKSIVLLSILIPTANVC